MMGTAYAMAPSPQGQGGGASSIIGFIPFILMFLVLYFLLIFPQQRKQKRHMELLTGLKKGDRVVTSGGIHGTILGFKEHVVTLRVDEKVKIDVERSSIAAVKGSEPGEQT